MIAGGQGSPSNNDTDEVVSPEAFSEMNKFKNQLLVNGEIKVIADILDLSFEKERYEIYFYCLAMVSPLMFHSDILHGPTKKTEWTKSLQEIVDELRQSRLH